MIMQKTYPKSFFRQMHPESQLTKTLLTRKPIYEDTTVVVLQVQYLSDVLLIVELINEHDIPVDSTTNKPTNDGWIPWTATADSKCPISPDAEVEVKIKNIIYNSYAHRFQWKTFLKDPDYNIIAYRIK